MTQVTIIGNLTADPELRFIPSGKAVANFCVAESSRIKDGQEWKDGPSTFWNCSVWGADAENFAESASKGVRVIVVGEAKQRSFETNAGEKRTVIDVTASEVGVSLKWSTASVTRAAGKPSGFNAKPQNQSPAVDDTDPWGSAPQIATDDAPPF
jgi:single-strand DNA-binding protein